MTNNLNTASAVTHRRDKFKAQSEKIRFVAVGAVNTAVDFVLLNVLVSIVGLPLIAGNIISTTVAMLVSFGLNKKIVFKNQGGDKTRQLVLFFVVTLTAIWIVQSGIIVVMSSFLHAATSWSDVIVLNVAKLFGIGGSLIWNYILYSRVVFKPMSVKK